jgi:hypothetical protein
MQIEVRRVILNVVRARHKKSLVKETHIMKRQSKLGLIVLSALTIFALVVGLGPASSFAASHREAPLIANDPTADITDFFMFRKHARAGKADRLVLIMDVIRARAKTGPNYYVFRSTSCMPSISTTTVTQITTSNLISVQQRFAASTAAGLFLSTWLCRRWQWTDQRRGSGHAPKCLSRW